MLCLSPTHRHTAPHELTYESPHGSPTCANLHRIHTPTCAHHSTPTLASASHRRATRAIPTPRPHAPRTACSPTPSTSRRRSSWENIPYDFFSFFPCIAHRCTVYNRLNMMQLGKARRCSKTISSYNRIPTCKPMHHLKKRVK